MNHGIHNSGAGRIIGDILSVLEEIVVEFRIWNILWTRAGNQGHDTGEKQKGSFHRGNRFSGCLCEYNHFRWL